MLLARVTRSYWLLAGLVASAVLLIFFADSLVKGLLSRVEATTMWQSQVESRLDVQERIVSLQLENDQLSKTVGNRTERVVPLLPDIQQLAQEHTVTVKRVERLNKVDSTMGIVRSYGLVFHGNPEKILAFLKAADERFICRMERLSLQAATKNGNTLALTALVFIKEL